MTSLHKQKYILSLCFSYVHALDKKAPTNICKQYRLPFSLISRVLLGEFGNKNQSYIQTRSPIVKTNQPVWLKFWVASLAFGIDCSQTWL